MEYIIHVGHQDTPNKMEFDVTWRKQTASVFDMQYRNALVNTALIVLFASTLEKRNEKSQLTGLMVLFT